MFSDSIANSGLQNIGQVTWRNAVENATDTPLVKPEQQDELRDWIREFGAWDDEEIAAMTDEETNALLLQFIAGDYQELQSYDSFEEYSEQAGGRLYPGDDGRWYFYVGI
jgi:hypothetical protein